MLPNIIHISWHDTGRHFGCYGVTTVHTPNVDRLAANGIFFENAFAVAVVCSPSRGACLTGRYPQSNGLIHLCHGNFGYRLNPGEKHLSELLHERGFHTALHGFQHEVDPNFIREQLPHFDEYANIDPAPPIYPIPPCDVVADGAVEFLESRAEDPGTPFYLQIGFFETHRPYEFGGCEPDDSLGVTIPPYLKSSDAARADHAKLQGSIRKADAALGSVLDALDRLNLAENTLVIFTPDHGLANPRAKATLYDPGLEIATILRWPKGGLTGGKRSDRLVSNVDLVPTIFSLFGWETSGQPFQGQSYAGLLGAGTEASARAEVFALHHAGDLRCVRTATHKLIRNFSLLRQLKAPVDIEAGGHEMLQKPDGKTEIAPVELYDLGEDPLETRNLADEPSAAEIRADLEDRLWRWMEACDDPILPGALTPPRHADHISQYQEWHRQACSTGS